MRTALIDGDSIIYVIAWLYKDQSDELLVIGAVDQFVLGILQATDAKQYVGALGHSQHKSFRYELAKYKPYKGTRGPKEEWVLRLEQLIRDRLFTEWGFISIPYLEADDIVAYGAVSGKFEDCVICSPDKDLRQIPGTHYDYQKQTFIDITTEQGEYIFSYLMLVGDETDNVAGLPGIGPKKAETALASVDVTVSFYEQMVREMYCKYFGNYYGNVIFEENKSVLGLPYCGSVRNLCIEDWIAVVLSSVQNAPQLQPIQQAD